MNNIRFILTPLDRIFFGEEKSPFKEEYFQRSRFFPQQTTLLGMLRYEILRRAGLLRSDNGLMSIHDQAAAKLLIGATSFDGEDLSAGIIKQLSPVCIWHKDDEKAFYPWSNTQSLTPKKLAGIKVFFSEEDEKTGYHLFDGFDPKNEDQLDVQLSDLQEDFIPLFMEKNEEKEWEGVLRSEIRTGITKSYLGEAKEEGYFKMETYRMREPYAYSFVAQLEDTQLIEEWSSPAIIRLGGDSCTYRLETKVETDYPWDQTQEGPYFRLLSDALVDQSVFDYCQSVVGQTINFRNIKSSIHQAHQDRSPVLDWQHFDLDTEQPTYPSRQLLAKGSILMAKEGEEEQLAQALTQYTAFKDIGYNYFIRLNSLS
jgi:CRISPR-associated protein Cmr3